MEIEYRDIYIYIYHIFILSSGMSISKKKNEIKSARRLYFYNKYIQQTWNIRILYVVYYQN